MHHPKFKWELTQAVHCTISFVSLYSYAESLASTRILKHSVESSRGSCGENLAWASYDQTGYFLHLNLSKLYSNSDVLYM